MMLMLCDRLLLNKCLTSGAICWPQVQTQNQTDDIFLAQILGHKLLGPNPSLSVGQSYKDFFVVGG